MICSKQIFTISALLCANLYPAQAKRHQASPNTPNVIVIMADDIGYGDLSCYGTQEIQTPHTDQLTKNGIRFTNAHAVAATSTPSRYAFLTGEYPFRKSNTDVAAGNAGMIIRPEQFTAADLFRSKGYTTAAIGKWHLGIGDKTGTQDWNAPLPCGPNDLGFDYTYIMAATADRVPCVFIENGCVANYDSSAPIYVSYTENFPGEPTGKNNPELLYNLKPSHEHNMSIVNGISRIGYMKGGGTALWKDENIADSITVHALDFIKENKDNPFFLYLCTNDIHVPRFPHERFRGKSKMGLRGDAILQFDWTVGQVTGLLKELNIEKNTIIILTSDNGPVLDDGYQDQAVALAGNHKPAGPYRGAKYSAFEGGTIVPFIVSWPGHITPGESHALVSQIDFLASLSALIRGTIPQYMACDSYNQWSTWCGMNPNGRPWALGLSSSHALSVKAGNWKYIEPNNGPEKIPWVPSIESGNSKEPQLYRIDQEPGETRNLAEQNPELVRKFNELIQEQKQRKPSISMNRNQLPDIITETTTTSTVTQ